MSNQQPAGPSPAMSVPSQPGGSSPRAQSAKRGVCLLILPRNQQAPEKLIQSLDRHGAVIVTCADAHTLLAHACRINRGEWMLAATPTAQSVSASSAVVIILVEPAALADLPRLSDLAESLRRYAPRSTLWFFEDGLGKNPLRAVTSDDLARWAATGKTPTHGEVAATPKGVAPSVFIPPIRTPLRGGTPGIAGDRNSSPTGPRLRLVEPDERAEGAHAAPAAVPAGEPRLDDVGLIDDDDARSPHLLTSEELAMLLGDPESFGEPLPPPSHDPIGDSPRA